MRPVTMVVPRLLLHHGGIERHVFELARRVKAAGHPIKVITQREPSDLPEYETIDGVEIHRMPAKARFRGQGNLSPDLIDAAHAATSDGHLVHVHDYHVPTSLAAVRAGGRDAVFTPHFLARHDRVIDRVAHRRYAIAGRRAADAAGAIIHVSASERNEFESALGKRPGRTFVVPNGVDVAATEAAEPMPVERPLVLVAGRLEEYKQVDRVVAAMLHLPGVQLTIAGDGTHRSAVESLVVALGLANRVTVLGHVAQPELRRWYRAASVTVSMSRRECFGLSLSEALTAGCAVVASDLPAHREVLELAGMSTRDLVAPDAGVTSVARAIGAALTHRRTARVDLPTWDDVAERTLAIYAAVNDGCLPAVDDGDEPSVVARVA